MRHVLWLGSLALLLASAASLAHGLLGRQSAPGAAAAERNDDGSGGPPPLVVDKDAPLLLEDPPQQEDPLKGAGGSVADNTACYCCHTNYEEEPMVLWHARADIGCVACHGQSYPHRNDENNVTPPDVMFPPEKIDASCQQCHKQHDAPAAEVVARWQKRCPQKTDPKRIVCTDCHGEHRLKLRTVRWDKRTRKLIVGSPGGRVEAPADPPEPPAGKSPAAPAEAVSGRK